MFKIGDFSRFSRVSVKMLRHYDELGLLRPAHVDTKTGYRYYAANQLPRLNQILLLRDLDFGLDQIQNLLDEQLTPEEIQGIVKLKRAEIEARLRADQRRLERLDQALNQPQIDSPLLVQPIILRDIPTQLVASIRKKVASNGIPPLFEHIEKMVAAHNQRAFLPPLTIFHDQEFAENWQDVEVAVPLLKRVDLVQAGINVYELSGGQMACTVFTGGYAGMEKVMSHYPQWLESQQLQPAGPVREVYLRFGAGNDGYRLPDAYLAENEAAFVTELQLPVVGR
ncbi:MAG: MerR family transcriptional regulator [Chloroflexota bacterium]